MLRFREKKVAKENFYAAKKAIIIWDFNVDNIVITKLVERKTNSKFLTGHLDKVMRPLFLASLKMSRNVTTVKVKDGDKDKNKKKCLAM